MRRSDVTEFTVTVRSPFCGYNVMAKIYRCYSNKIEPVSLRKCPCDHWLTIKAYLSAITVTNISQSFYLQLTGIDTELNYVTVTLCIQKVCISNAPNIRQLPTYTSCPLCYALVTARRIRQRGIIVVARCLCVCLPQARDSVFCGNGWTDRADFWQGGLLYQSNWVVCV